MYDELCGVLEKIQAKVAWYALGEAVRLAKSIQGICNQFRKGAKDSQAHLLRVAGEALSFLRKMGKASDPDVVEAQKIIDRIRLEIR